jgi:hypothetical protein
MRLIKRIRRHGMKQAPAGSGTTVVEIRLPAPPAYGVSTDYSSGVSISAVHVEIIVVSSSPAGNDHFKAQDLGPRGRLSNFKL